MKNICITGANGFIGKYLCNALISSNKSIRGFVRNLDSLTESSKIDYRVIKDISSKINWKKELSGYDCIIHCAGKSHSTNVEENSNAYFFVNTEAAIHLAEQAAEAGVKRLVFLSSVKVNGESTNQITKQKFSYKDMSNPKDLYAISKFKAEKA